MRIGQSIALPDVLLRLTRDGGERPDVQLTERCHVGFNACQNQITEPEEFVSKNTHAKNAHLVKINRSSWSWFMLILATKLPL